MTDKLNYDDYVKQCKSVNCDPETEEVYNKAPELRGVSGPSIASTAGSFITGVAAKTTARILKGEAPQASVVKALQEEGIRFVDEIQGVKVNMRLGYGGKQDQGSGSAPPGDDGTLPSVPKGANPNSPNLLGMWTPNPINISLNSNINPRIYTNTLNEPSSFTSFNHLTGARFQFNASSDYLIAYITNVMIPYLVNRIQMAVSFNVNVSVVTYANLVDYLDKIARALQVYYFYARILSYTSVPLNPDRGMFALRQMISATDIDLLTQIKQQLQSFPIPPNLNKLCFWLMQSYTDGTNTTSVLGFMPFSFANVTNTNVVTGFSSTVLSGVYSDLAGLNSTGLVPILSRTLPNWVLEDVYDPVPTPVYDDNWLTLWSNCPYAAYNTTQLWGPLNSNTTNYWASYCVHSNNPDGLVTGLANHGIPNNAVSFAVQKWVNNLFPIVTSQHTYNTTNPGDYYCNRYSYCQPTTGNPVWRCSNVGKESAMGRPDVYRLYLADDFFARLDNTIKIVNMNGDTANTVGRDVITWVLSFDTIPDKQEEKKKFFDSGKPRRK